MRAKNIMRTGSRPASAKRAIGRIAPIGLAALLLGAAGASFPGYAEITPSNAPAPMLVPATTQANGFEAAFSDYATSPTASEDEATAEEPKSTPGNADFDTGPVFEDPGQAIGGGMASYYGREFAGRKTASGERFDPAGYTAAHRSLPFGSKVRVTHVATGKSVVVRINDRGPFSHGRVIDLSQAAASELGIVRAGSGKVSLAVLSN